MASEFSTITNPLATVAQLQTSGSQLDGVPAELEDSILFAGAALTQSAGVLLRLPQDVIAKVIVIFQRFWLGPEGGSLREYGAKDISAACMYLVTKPSSHPKSPRSIINVYAYLSSTYSKPDQAKPPSSESYYISEGTYQKERDTLMKHETLVLRHLGFQLHVSLPYILCINYLQTLEVFLPPNTSTGHAMTKRAFAYLNTALLSPQLLYLTHQPSTLAVAAIYLAAKDEGGKLPEEEWWEVFDCEREDLGFLAVGMLSLENFAQEEHKTWLERGRSTPLTLAGLESELKARSSEASDNDTK